MDARLQEFNSALEPAVLIASHECQVTGVNIALGAALVIQSVLNVQLQLL